MQIQTKGVDGATVESATQRVITVDDMDWPVPPGASHYSKMYVGSRPIFWRKVGNGLDTLSGQQFYCWACYDNGQWLKDPTACSRHFISLTE